MMDELAKLEEALKVLDNPELGNMLALYRKSRGITQEALAEMIDCHPITISKLERKEMEITVEWAAKIIRAIATLKAPTPLIDPLRIVQNICVHRGISLGGLATKVGIAPSTLTRAFNDEDHPFELSVKTLNKIIAWDNSQP